MFKHATMIPHISWRKHKSNKWSKERTFQDYNIRPLQYLPLFVSNCQARYIWYEHETRTKQRTLKRGTPLYFQLTFFGAVNLRKQSCTQQKNPFDDGETSVFLIFDDAITRQCSEKIPSCHFQPSYLDVPHSQAVSVQKTLSQPNIIT